MYKYRVTIYLLEWVCTSKCPATRRWRRYAKRLFETKKQAVSYASYIAGTKACRKVSLQRLPKKNDREGY